MKNSLRLIGLFFLGAVLFASCSEDKKTFEELTPEGTVVFTQNVTPDFFDLGDIENSSVSFDLGTAGETASTVIIYKSYNGGAPVEHARVTSIPSTITVTAAEAIDGLGITFDDLAVGDNIALSFEVEAGGTTYGSGKVQNIPVTCFSDLAGIHSYTTTSTWCGSTDPLTGTVEWTSPSTGIYEVSDWGYGSYQDCYGSEAAAWGSLQLQDVCNVISQLGEDNYGDTWEFNITGIDGPTLSFSWTNTYGESGTVELVRDGGVDWPPLSN